MQVLFDQVVLHNYHIVSCACTEDIYSSYIFLYNTSNTMKQQLTLLLYVDALRYTYW